MTEEEAKAKCCPVSLSLNSRGYCIGSACMAWRPVAMVFINADGAEIGRTEDKQNGFCGLAGGRE